MEKIENRARDRLAAGELTLGVAVRMARTVDIAPAMLAAGFDWLFIDLEHGSIPLDTVAQMCTTALACGISPLVRVPKGEVTQAARALDNGAGGVIFPHVDTVEEAREAVAHVKFPPIGNRSMGPVPQLQFRQTPLPDAMGMLNRSGLTVIMLESPEAIEHADSIAAIEGVDVVMIGTNDLCAELGIPGQFDNPRVVECYGKVLAACDKHRKWPGMGGVYDDAIAPRYIAMGMRFVLAAVDMNLMTSAAAARTTLLRSNKAG